MWSENTDVPLPPCCSCGGNFETAVSGIGVDDEGKRKNGDNMSIVRVTCGPCKVRDWNKHMTDSTGENEDGIGDSGNDKGVRIRTGAQTLRDTYNG